jgi:hypothetical protein
MVHLQLLDEQLPAFPGARPFCLIQWRLPFSQSWSLDQAYMVVAKQPQSDLLEIAKRRSKQIWQDAPCNCGEGPADRRQRSHKS